MPARPRLLAAMASFFTLMAPAHAQPSPQTGAPAVAPTGPSSSASTAGSGGGESQVIDHTVGSARPSHADPGRTTNEGSPGSDSTPGSAGQGNVHEPHPGTPK
jgi:hypothetical protein